MQKSNNILNEVTLLLGSNLGDKIKNIITAEKDLSTFLDIIKFSSFYESVPWGYQSKNTFINRAILVKCYLNPLELLMKIKAIEKKMGRIKNELKGYEDRLIDIDILTFNNEHIDEVKLIVPHPRISERRFTILPLMDLYDECKIPGLNNTAKCLLKNCKDELQVNKIDV